MGLFWHYMGRVLAFTFRGSVRQADGWQIVAGGTALPSIALGVIYGFLGQNMPTIEQAEWATYFGYGLVTWLAIRFLIAPFFIWKEQYQEAAELRLELSKPERKVLEHMAKHRAKARVKAIKKLEALHTVYFGDDLEKIDREAAGLTNDLSRIMHQTGLPSIRRVLIRFEDEARSRHQGGDVTGTEPKDFEILADIHAFLNDQVTAEYLHSRWPLNIEPEKPQ